MCKLVTLRHLTLPFQIRLEMYPELFKVIFFLFLIKILLITWINFPSLDGIKNLNPSWLILEDRVTMSCDVTYSHDHQKNYMYVMYACYLVRKPARCIRE